MMIIDLEEKTIQADIIFTPFIPSGQGRIIVAGSGVLARVHVVSCGMVVSTFEAVNHFYSMCTPAQPILCHFFHSVPSRLCTEYGIIYVLRA